jgi:hypothetical protein
MVLLDPSIIKELLANRPPTLEVVAQTLDTEKRDKAGVQQYSINEQCYSIAMITTTADARSRPRI